MLFNSGLKVLSSDIVDKWMTKIREKTENTDNNNGI